MKKLLSILAILISTINQNVFCCNTQQMDSLFYTHLSISRNILDSCLVSDSTKINTRADNCFFWDMLNSLKIFNFELHGYSHQPRINRFEVKMVENWYKDNREILNCEKIIPLFFAIKKVWTISVPYELYDTFDTYMEKTDENFKEIDNLMKLDTFTFTGADLQSMPTKKTNKDIK